MRNVNIHANVALLLLAVSAASGVPIAEFHSWHDLTAHSPDIIVGQCVRTPDPYHRTTNGVIIDVSDRMIDSQIQVLSVLKGSTKPGLANISSQCWPRQGEVYLIFSDYHDEFYQAVESYRVVPLGVYAGTNFPRGKTLDERIQVLLKRRLDNLTRQMKEEQKEKQRLEEGIKK